MKYTGMTYFQFMQWFDQDPRRRFDEREATILKDLLETFESKTLSAIIAFNRCLQSPMEYHRQVEIWVAKDILKQRGVNSDQ